MAPAPERTDVLIIGGGPAGLLIGYALQRMNVTTCIVECLDKAAMPMYGRACSLYPRTLEMLDQLELLDEFTQIGFIGRNSVNYKDGKRAMTRGWQSIFTQLGETFHNYCLNIRLKYSERLIQDAYERLGGRVIVKWELRSMTWDHSGASDGDRVRATIGAVNSEETMEVNCRYLIGADGGSSTVRQLTEIPFPMDRTTHTWVRIDGVVKTDMPDAQLGFGSIESPTHGNVLWVALDHGRSRIGFALNAEMVQRYGRQLTQEQAVAEAKAAMAPFSVEFEKVDWHTTYSIRQAVADHFMLDDCIFLAGDACHVHSSGAAQGMNTGVHDAVNLAWKLGGVLRGWYRPDVLRTYEDERRPAAQHLIQLDRDYSALISGEIPAHFSKEASAEELLTKAWSDEAQFTTGLGVHYGENALNQEAEAGTVATGWRAPDGLLFGPGPRVPVRLQTLTPNTGAFWVVVFAGEPLLTHRGLQELRTHLDGTESFVRWMHPDSIHFLTVIYGTKHQGEVALGMESFGKFYYDPDGSVHERTGFTPGNGGVAVIRPDGILGYATPLSAGKKLESYFSQIAMRYRVNGAQREDLLQ